MIALRNPMLHEFALSGFNRPLAAMGGHHQMWLLSAILMVVLPSAIAELTPPYFNLAEGRKILASSTCGLDIDGPELYCKLVGSHTDDQQNKTLFDYHDDHFHTAALSRQGHVVIQGQVRWSATWFWKSMVKEENYLKNWFTQHEYNFSKILLIIVFSSLVDDLLTFQAKHRRLPAFFLWQSLLIA